MLGQKSLAPKMAVLHNIPLVFYGENEAEYGNPRSDTDRRQARLELLHRAGQEQDLSSAACRCTT